MSVSHRLRVDIACPACRASGVIRVVEDAGPPFDDTPRRTYAVDPGMFVLTAGPPANLECRTCGRNFPAPL